MNKIILIGGAPATGKTTLASKLSKELGIPWISTDSIREVMRSSATKNGHKGLFYFVDKKAEPYLKSHKATEIVGDQNKESFEVWEGIKSFISSTKNYNPKISLQYIIEGVAILPSLIHKDFSASDFIKPVFLLDSNKDRIQKVIYDRGLWDEARKYSDNIKYLEVEWVLEFNNWLKKDLKKYNYPTIEIGNKKELISKIKKIIS